jgi:hypothetical protein
VCLRQTLDNAAAKHTVAVQSVCPENTLNADNRVQWRVLEENPALMEGESVRPHADAGNAPISPCQR